MKYITFNYYDQPPHYKQLVNQSFTTHGQSVLLINKPIQLNGKNMSKSVYVCHPGEKLDIKGSAYLVTIPDSQEFDIHGGFTPMTDNSDHLDDQHKTKHTLLIGNVITVFDQEKIAQLSKNKAFSKHLKAELVEFTPNSLVPPHCHGTAFFKKQFIEKYQDKFKFQELREKYPHPQLIFVLKGSGTFYLNLDEISLAENDVLVYGSNVIHMAGAGPRGMVYIHFVWNQR